MGRMVKCFDTGGQIDRDLAYIEKVSGNRNRFWSSEDAYNNWVEQNDSRELSILLLKDILGYDKPQMKLPTITYKKISELEVYGYDVLLNTIKNQIMAFDWALKNKQFNSETAKIQYLFAIINNNIMVEYKKKQHDIKLAKIQEAKKSEIIEDIDIQNRKQSTTNISQWLGED